MTSVTSRYQGNLGLPLGGPVLRPGVPTHVKRWDIIKGHPVVKAWLAAKVIEADAPEIAEKAPPAPIEARHPLDHDGDGVPGGSLPASERDICDQLRAEYADLTGKAADRRWGEARLRQEIDKALGE